MLNEGKKPGTKLSSGFVSSNYPDFLDALKTVYPGKSFKFFVGYYNDDSDCRFYAELNGEVYGEIDVDQGGEPTIYITDKKLDQEIEYVDIQLVKKLDSTESTINSELNNADATSDRR
jgi:hypothetical protein